MKRKTKINEMAEMLNGYGPIFCGNNVADEAQDWLDHNFSLSDANDWCGIGVWDAATAAEFRDAGLIPDEVEAASERLIEAEQAAWDDSQWGDSQYTDGSPIYAACNSDISASVIIAACGRG